MVKVIINDTVVAESSETVFVEGNYYFPPEAIKGDLFISDTTYTCPHKGNASYYSAKVNGAVVKDIAWLALSSTLIKFLSFALRVYPEPTSKFEIKGRYAFDKKQVRIDTSDPATGSGSGNRL
ncbi:DUF427-domain-containing protein [Russula earlei]|uniref:DUF427-domain-containing protein n=1 Tax=Russula earlei TaxID=71964 RepID=A0ACC0UBV0_9AGAM|nr:DUF427-domain-containing protein [Russula earlei]